MLTSLSHEQGSNLQKPCFYLHVPVTAEFLQCTFETIKATSKLEDGKQLLLDTHQPPGRFFSLLF
jgi:hypothetical protein